MRVMLGLLSILGLTACGGATDSSLMAEGSSQVFEGIDGEGAPCRLAVQIDANGRPTQLKVEATFVADYKIPMPFSGLYGKYRWPGTFDSLKNAGESFEVKRSLLGDADVVKAEGEPLFWNTGKHAHKLVVKPSLAAPQSLSYDAKEKLAAVVTTVDISLACRFE